MVLALIWVDRPARWVDILVYVTVAVTVLSGVDYFYRLRKLLGPELRRPRRRATRASTRDAAEGSPPATRPAARPAARSARP